MTNSSFQPIWMNSLWFWWSNRVLQLVLNRNLTSGHWKWSNRRNYSIQSIKWQNIVLWWNFSFGDAFLFWFMDSRTTCSLLISKFQNLCEYYWVVITLKSVDGLNRNGEFYVNDLMWSAILVPTCTMNKSMDVRRNVWLVNAMCDEDEQFSAILTHRFILSRPTRWWYRNRPDFTSF